MKAKQQKLKTKRLVGWMSVHEGPLKLRDEEAVTLNVYRTRGVKGEWNPTSWPPQKVRITVEEIE